ncbi:uncharacterized protein LOC131580898 [Poecile atricapillus]|uniref:uncharacterized protein LOC131580898 n=1 Tax=Poecile atricapillus TaxID=48891 RepID=UPI002739676D|nr:uncharacterized protein LOC131580898 [Poecile atricapillus]
MNWKLELSVCSTGAFPAHFQPNELEICKSLPMAERRSSLQEPARGVVLLHSEPGSLHSREFRVLLSAEGGKSPSAAAGKGSARGESFPENPCVSFVGKVCPAGMGLEKSSCALRGRICSCLIPDPCPGVSNTSPEPRSQSWSVQHHCPWIQIHDPNPGESNTTSDPSSGVSNTVPDPCPGESNTIPDPCPGVSNTIPDPCPGVSNTIPDPCPGESNTTGHGSKSWSVQHHCPWIQIHDPNPGESNTTLDPSPGVSNTNPDPSPGESNTTAHGSQPWNIQHHLSWIPIHDPSPGTSNTSPGSQSQHHCHGSQSQYSTRTAQALGPGFHWSGLMWNTRIGRV